MTLAAKRARIAEMEQDYLCLRERMVRSQIADRGIKDERVLAAMREIPRHLFVPASLEPQAYEDKPLPIGEVQTISQPYIVALMTELLHPQPGDMVLEIGTGSGYQTAILSRLARKVYTIEIAPSLATEAARRLSRLGFLNVETKAGDGYKGWPEHAPFDGILVAAAPPQVPEALVAQLKRGGRMVLPVGQPRSSQQLLLLEKSRDSEEIAARKVIPVQFVPMVSEPEQIPPFEGFDEEDSDRPVPLEVADILDLHSFRPRDVKDVVTTYLEEARTKGFSTVRIIHGKGIGMHRDMVRAILEKTDFVAHFQDAPAEAGGWGATLVWFAPETSSRPEGTVNQQ